MFKILGNKHYIIKKWLDGFISDNDLEKLMEKKYYV